MIATKTTVREWQPWYKKVWNWITSDQAPIAVIEYQAQKDEDMALGTYKMSLSAEGTKRLEVGKRYDWDLEVVNITDVKVMTDPLIMEPFTFKAPVHNDWPFEVEDLYQRGVEIFTITGDDPVSYTREDGSIGLLYPIIEGREWYIKEEVKTAEWFDMGVARGYDIAVKAVGKDNIPWYPCDICDHPNHPTDAHDFCERAAQHKEKE